MPFLCQQWLGFWGPSSQHDIINGVNLTWTRQIRFAYRQRYLSTSLGLNQGSRKYGLYAIGNLLKLPLRRLKINNNEPVADSSILVHNVLKSA